VAAREQSERGAADRLRDLAALRAEGLVDDVEFERKRAEMVDAL
jgi:hypothetical protein